MASTYQVIITEPAEKDLEELLEYIIEKSSHQSATKVKRSILDAIGALAKMPERHAPVKEIQQGKNITYRRVIIKKTYRIMYHIEEIDKAVYVVRILHVKRGPNFVKNALK